MSGTENDAGRKYAASDEERCYYEDCWRLDGHEGLHAYHPSVFGFRVQDIEAAEDRAEQVAYDAWRERGQ